MAMLYKQKFANKIGQHKSHPKLNAIGGIQYIKISSTPIKKIKKPGQAACVAGSNSASEETTQSLRLALIGSCKVK